MADFNPQTRTPGAVQRATLVNESGFSDLPNQVAVLAYRSTTGGSKGDTLDNTPVEITSRSQATDWFGVGSQMDLTARDAFATGTLARNDQPAGNMPVFLAVPLAPPSGAAATYTVTIGGAGTAAGFITMDVLDQTIRVDVANLGTPTDAALALDTALLAVENELPLTSSVALGVMTLTWREDGVWGNGAFVRVDVSEAPGLTVTIATGVAGTGVVVIDTALANVLNEQFVDSVVCNQSDSVSRTALKTHIGQGWDFVNDRPRVGIFPTTGDTATAQTDAVALDDWRICAVNGEQLVGTGQPLTDKSARSLPSLLATSLAVLLSSRPRRPNANHNQARIAGYAYEGLPVRSITDNTLDGGVTPLFYGGDARVLRPISTAITDQTINAGPTPAPDKRWQPIEIAYTVLNVWRDMRAILEKYTTEDVTDDIAQRAKMDALRVLRRRQADEWITGITDDSALVTVVESGGSNRLLVKLKYSVLVNIDVVAVNHKVQR